MTRVPLLLLFAAILLLPSSSGLPLCTDSRKLSLLLGIICEILCSHRRYPLPPLWVSVNRGTHHHQCLPALLQLHREKLLQRHRRCRMEESV